MNRPVEWFPGEWNFCCDRCGFEFKSSQARHEWTGLIVCPYCWDPRHPQDFVRGRVDRIAVPWVRICCDDTFLPDILKVQLWSTARGGDNSAGVGSLSSVSSPSLALVPSQAFAEYNTRCTGAVDVVSIAFDDADGRGSMYILDSATPANDLDVFGDLDALSAYFTNAGEAKYIFSPDNSGYMKWSAHNLFLNSGSPADQNVTVVSGQLYAVIITGATTTTISGAGSGSLSAGTNTFTAVTTTLTFGSTTGTGTITVCKWPADTTYLATTGSPRYALPIERDANGNVLGLRTESGETNNVTGSNNFAPAGGWSVNGVTMTQNQTDAGGIANRAWEMAAGPGTANKYIQTFFGSGQYTNSIFAKAGANAGWICIWDKGAQTDGAYFDLVNGVVGTVYGSGAATRIRDIGNGWYECSHYASSTASHFMNVSIHDADDQTIAWTSDGDETVLISDGQIEGVAVGSYGSSRIPTFGAGVSRNDDDLTLPTSMWNHNATVNTAAVEWVPLATNDLPPSQAMALHDGTANEQVKVWIPTGGKAALTVVDGGANQTSPLASVASPTALVQNRIAVKWKANDFLLSLDGATAVADTSGTLPTVTTLQVGQTGTSSVLAGSWLKHIIICPGEDSNAAAIESLATAE